MSEPYEGITGANNDVYNSDVPSNERNVHEI